MIFAKYIRVKHRLRTVFSRVSVLLFTLLISGCSTFGFVFERLDWFTLWRLDSMFDLTEEQEDQVRPDLLAIQEWMRQEGFPETISKLEVLIEVWDADEPEAAYRYLMSSMASLNGIYLNAMKDGVVTFSLHLTEENASHYRDYSDEKQTDWFDSVRSLEARIDKEVERLENWFGHLNDQQVAVIENWASMTENELQVRIDNHLSWREGYLQAALNRDAALIRAWLDDLSIFWTREYALLKEHNAQQRQALLFELFPTLSSKQKFHAREYVEDLIEKLRDVLPREAG
jgi:hypothetical protein